MSPMNTNPAGETPPLADLHEAANAPRRSEILPEAAGGEAVEACFLWIDEESGDELVIEAQGSASFFAQLEALGFLPHVPLPAEALAEDGQLAGPGVQGERRGESAGVRRSARLDVAKGGARALRDLWRTRLGA